MSKNLGKLDTTTVKEQWDTFYNAVLMPLNASLVQIQEMRRAFYAGVEAMMRISIKFTEYDDDTAERILQGVETELHQFALDVKAGKK